MPCSKMGTTAVSRYWRRGSAVTSSLFWVSSAAFSAIAAATGSSYPARALGGWGAGWGRGASSSMGAARDQTFRSASDPFKANLEDDGNTGVGDRERGGACVAREGLGGGRERPYRQRRLLRPSCLVEVVVGVGDFQSWLRKRTTTTIFGASETRHESHDWPRLPTESYCSDGGWPRLHCETRLSRVRGAACVEGTNQVGPAPRHRETMATFFDSFARPRTIPTACSGG